MPDKKAPLMAREREAAWFRYWVEFEDVGCISVGSPYVRMMREGECDVRVLRSGEGCCPDGRAVVAPGLDQAAGLLPTQVEETHATQEEDGTGG